MWDDVRCALGISYCVFSNLFSELTQLFSLEIHCQFSVPNVWMSKWTLNVLTNKKKKQTKNAPTGIFTDLENCGSVLFSLDFLWQLLLPSSSDFRKHCHYNQKSDCKISTLHLRDLSLVYLEKSLLTFQGETRKAEAKSTVFHCLLAVLLGTQSHLTQHPWYYLPVQV